MRASEKFQILRPLEEAELRLVRATLLNPSLVSAPDEAVLRTALSMARLYKVRHEGKDIAVGASLAGFREEVTRLLEPVLLGKTPPREETLGRIASRLKPFVHVAKQALLERLKSRVPREAIDHEIRHKALVLVSGGGGGTAYVSVGVMALLEEFGLKPSMMAGTSMGAIISLFRSRLPRFDYTEIAGIVRSLSWKKLFRAISMESRYGLPAALRLFLRAGIGRYFNVGSESHGAGIRLRDLAIPTLVTVSGIRRGMLPHPLEFYERLLSVNARGLFDPRTLARGIQSTLTSLSELFLRPEIMVKLTLGMQHDTPEFDAIDAAGFSCALPGIIHYDVLREEPFMHELLKNLLEEKGIFRLVDGGLTDNLPAKEAWNAVHNGFIGTRNVFILALNGFSPKLGTPLWLPLEQLAEITVAPNRPYAHLLKDFRRTLSPIDLVPSVEQFSRAAQLGREQFLKEMPLVSKMLSPLPILEGMG